MSAVATQQSAEVDALIQSQDEEFSDSVFQTPILKVCQSLTKEVKAGDAEPGDFYNTLTAEDYGKSVQFIVSHPQRGRAHSMKDGRYLTAIGQDLIPESWKDLVGEEFVGTRFDEYPDAEEQYKARVNAGEIEWGSGPKISTTYNYTGLVIPPALDDEEPEPMPVRIGFLRTTKPAHDKLQTLKKATLRNKPFWAVVFELSTAVKTSGRHESFVVNVKKVRDSTPEEQQQATELALAVTRGNTRTNEDAEAPEAKAEPSTPKGAVAL